MQVCTLDNFSFAMTLIIYNFLSPSQGPCCYADTCRFIPSSRSVMCRGEGDCSYSSYCDGTTPECPVPPSKPNKTRCNEGTQVFQLFL